VPQFWPPPRCRLEHGVGVRANSEQRDGSISVLKVLDSLDEVLDERFFHGILLMRRNYSAAYRSIEFSIAA
jgi:hypothetical protein